MLTAQFETLQRTLAAVEGRFGEYRNETQHAMVAIGAELAQSHPQLAGVVNAVIEAETLTLPKSSVGGAGRGEAEGAVGAAAGEAAAAGGATADSAGAPAQRATLLHLTAVAAAEAEAEARESDDRSDDSCGHVSDDRCGSNEDERCGSEGELGRGISPTSHRTNGHFARSNESNERSGSEERGSGSDHGSDHSGSNGHSEGGASHGSGASGGAGSNASSSNATSSSCEPRSEISGSSGPTSNSISS